jgi:uncharacterized protein YPO0396
MSSSGQEADFMTPAEQFRMTRLHVFNWGTFDGLHDVKVSGKGFLFLGGSGSGKTTLLDGISALLVPPRWIDFNAAAREAAHRGKDRNWVTYVRGAWGDQQDDSSGEIVTRCLRKGPTWSALALTYRSTRDRIVTLVQIFWIRGTSTAAGDVRRHHIIFERAFDLAELKDFDLDLRRLKQSLPDGIFFENFNPYRERFGRLLGIENERALRLLHKTQSAKNLEDLNSFLREFMLDRPSTFDVADQLVSEFAELNEAHQAVVTAREQVKTLRPAQEQHQRLLQVQAECLLLEHLLNGIDLYRESLRKNLLENRIDELRVQIDGIVGQRERQRATVDNHKAALRDLEDRHRELGGDQIERLEAEQKEKEHLRMDRLGKQEQVQIACQKLEWPFPQSPEEFAQQIGQARQELDQRQEQSRLAKVERDKKVQQRNELGKDLQDISYEVDSLRRQPSNIPRHMLDLRHSLAVQLGLPDDVLPFVGELLEVTPEEAIWRGAIERVLHGFALSILVQERNYISLSNLVNSTHLGNRLVYYRTGRGDTSAVKAVPLISLVRKLKIKEGEHYDWLDAELKKRFDYTCVDSAQALRQTERGLTREGLVRHGPHRHEKDDRHRVDDRFHWVLGFDNRDKLALFEKQRQTLAKQVDTLDREIATIERLDEKRGERALHCNTLANLRWEEIDVAPIVERIAAIIRELKSLRAGNKPLARIAGEIEKERKRLNEAEEILKDIEVQLREAEKQRKDSVMQLENAMRKLADDTLTSAQSERLAPRFGALGEKTTLENLAEHSQRVERELSTEHRKLTEERNRLEKNIEQCFFEFKQRWPVESGDVDATLASAQDFLAKLKRLEVDGLPQYEHRFFKLLKEQSNQNLASLNTQVRQARIEIRERMDLVNESLKHADFNEGTHLRIEVSDRALPEVQDFKREVHEALSHAWTENREIAEDRFGILSRLVQRMASQDPHEQRWREVVLDVRQHVDFTARELDRDGREIEIYRSGAGKSGGQRQKLATTCLAAALKYQLGGTEQDVPKYAAVVLDEAFDKADHDYTRMAMEIFKKLGFQMIVATPLKSVMTLEPFIGGACFVDIKDRQRSGVLLIEYDEETNRLDLPEQARGESSVAVS